MDLRVEKLRDELTYRVDHTKNYYDRVVYQAVRDWIKRDRNLNLAQIQQHLVPLANTLRPNVAIVMTLALIERLSDERL